MGCHHAPFTLSRRHPGDDLFNEEDSLSPGRGWTSRLDGDGYRGVPFEYSADWEGICRVRWPLPPLWIPHLRHTPSQYAPVRRPSGHVRVLCPPGETVASCLCIGAPFDVGGLPSADSQRRWTNSPKCILFGHRFFRKHLSTSISCRRGAGPFG